MIHGVKRTSLSLLLALALPFQASAAAPCGQQYSNGTEYVRNAVCDTRRDKDSTTEQQKQEENVNEANSVSGCVVNENGVCIIHIECDTNRSFIADNGLTSGSCSGSAATEKPCESSDCKPTSEITPANTPCVGSGCESTKAPEAAATKTPTAEAPTAAPATQEPTAAPTISPTKAPTAKPTAEPTAKPQNTGASAAEAEAVSLMNEDRLRNGMAALPVDAELSKIARLKAEDMRDNGYFAHESPTYGRMADMLTSMGYKYSAAGENIAHHASVLKAEAAFMSSAGHKRNILSASWTKVGIGIAIDKNGYIYECQVFAR
jgi:uncharacterized protein YkwD